VNLRKLNDDLTDVVAQNLHYFDHQDKIFSMKTSDEVRLALEGGIARYQSDPVFAAKVKTMVAQVIRCVSNAAVEKE
jgi:hypothetical protein